MLKRNLLIIVTVLCCFTFKVYAQHVVDDRHYPDSLQSMLRMVSADTAKADILLLLSDYWSGKDTVKALEYAHESLDLTKGNHFYEAVVHFYIAGIRFFFLVNKRKEA